VREERVDALRAFGFTERQARFLVTVLIHSGVFVPRQYRAFAGVAAADEAEALLRKLVGRDYATAATPGGPRRGRVFHVQYTPFYERIGVPGHANRERPSLGRLAVRLMLLDAVLADTRVTWLGTSHDKLEYFIVNRRLDLKKEWYPHIAVGQGGDRRIWYFPDRLPIGVPCESAGRHVFLYLMTRAVPMDFRVFLLRHADLLAALDGWVLRIVIPRRLRRAAALHRDAIRDGLASPLTPREVEELDWLFRARPGRACEPPPDADLTLATARWKYRAARFHALRRVWKADGKSALWAAQSPTVMNQLMQGRGRLEFVEFRHHYPAPIKVTQSAGRFR
jgi:hypothetical protein